MNNELMNEWWYVEPCPYSGKHWEVLDGGQTQPTSPFPTCSLHQYRKHFLSSYKNCNHFIFYMYNLFQINDNLHSVIAEKYRTIVSMSVERSLPYVDWWRVNINNLSIHWWSVKKVLLYSLKFREKQNILSTIVTSEMQRPVIRLAARWKKNHHSTLMVSGIPQTFCQDPLFSHWQGLEKSRE